MAASELRAKSVEAPRFGAKYRLRFQPRTSPKDILLLSISDKFRGRPWQPGLDVFLPAGAAGRALEGGEVLFGMSANPGAIDKITIDPATLEPVFSTINGIKPKGLSGSGLIDILAESSLPVSLTGPGGSIRRALTPYSESAHISRST